MVFLFAVCFAQRPLDAAGAAAMIEGHNRQRAEVGMPPLRLFQLFFFFFFFFFCFF